MGVRHRLTTSEYGRLSAAPIGAQATFELYGRQRWAADAGKRMLHENDVNDLVRRTMRVSLPLSVTVLGDGRVAVVEGHGVAERVVVRAPDRDDLHNVLGGGVRRILGDAGGRLLAEIGGGSASAAVVALPSLARVTDLADGEMPCVVGSQLCVIGPVGIRFPSAEPEKKPWEASGLGEIVSQLVRAVGTAAVAWVSEDSAGFHLRIVSWHESEPEITTITLDARPQDLAVSPAGRRIALVLRGRVILVEDGRVVDVPDARAEPGICWLDEERLCWISRQWPDSALVTHSFDDGSRTSEVFAGWTLGRLYRSGDAAAAIATRHRRPPMAIETARLSRADLSHPEFGSVEVSGGSLRMITFPPDRPPTGLVIMLRGGPYGEWLPGWDPIVETIEESGWVAVQLESPYTAAVLGRLPVFRRGQFGTRDAALVAEAAGALTYRFGLNTSQTTFVGHSYGAFLAARATAHLGAPVAGLVTMNGPWTTGDLLAMGADPATGNSLLSRFLRQAFPADTQPPAPEQEARDLPKHWRVIYGTADTTASAAITERAVNRDRPSAVLRLDGEPHIPRRRESIAETMRFLDTWLRGVGSS
ncbi:alpha/beta hydrolase family protein [Nonomuraea sp. KM88]|uniref:alpha/beta hydrolase family protein n=1 Tax=Nonomuraea sp. KM88 TaxID=3457427 RepID=UPI003FCD7E0C